MSAAYEHNRRPVSREAFYAIACDPRRSVAVEACAGAGKTWMLVSRILRALLEGGAPHEILAITFTKKAAGEMRERLHDWLAEFAQAPPQKLAQELMARGLDAAAAQAGTERLQGLLRQLLEAGRPVQIRTFHSWFAALLRTAPLELLQSRGLPPHYELLEDDAAAVAEVWRRFHTGVADTPALRADYEAVVAVHGRSQTLKALETALAKRVEFSLADADGVVDASVPPFGALFPEWAALDAPAQALDGETARARWLAWAKALGGESNKTPQQAANAVVDAFMATDLDARLDRLRKAFFVAAENRLTKNLQKFEAAQQAEAELQRLCEARLQHEAWRHQQRMARLTRRLIEDYAALKRERGWVDMNDVESAAMHMLSDAELSGWVQERLDARVRQLLIDEFQDTNPLQWQALHAWLAGYTGAGGGSAAPSVFIVGDPKQSIYRFRRAEPQVFRAAQAFVVEGLGGDLLSCDHTRRNATGVIATVNAVMDAAQQAREYEGFRSHTTESTLEGAVLRLPAIARPDAADAAQDSAAPAWRDSLCTPREEPEETLRTRECRQAARWVAAQLRAGLAPEDVMVLARKRDRLAVMQDELRHLGIPTEQPEKADLAEAPEVQDVVALIDALVSPGHDLSLARALRSPLFGLDDAALTALALRRRALGAEGGSWFDLLQSQTWTDASLQPVGAMLQRYQGWVDTLPPHDALAAIYHDGDLLARFAAVAPAPQRERVLANLRALLAAALQLQGARYLTPYALVRAFRKGGIKAPNRANGQAVRLLTVHGAKGLEARAVLMLDTDAPPPRAETMTVLVDWPGEAAAPRAFVFLASESRPPASVQGLLAAEQHERQREELNALYVAMTRARDQLVLSSVVPRNAAPTSWWARLLPLAAEAVPAADGDVGAPGEPAAARAGFSLRVLPQRPALPDAALALPQPPESSEASRLGQAMHWLLEHVDQPQAAAAREGAAAALARLAREFELTLAQARLAAAMAQRILAGEGAWAWDPAQIDWQGNEVPLLHGGQLLRLDRLVRHRTQGWWVLDYKSALQPEQQAGLIAQLQRYRTAVQAVYPGETVSAAFLTGEGRLVELTAAA